MVGPPQRGPSEYTRTGPEYAAAEKGVDGGQDAPKIQVMDAKGELSSLDAGGRPVIGEAPAIGNQSFGLEISSALRRQHVAGSDSCFLPDSPPGDDCCRSPKALNASQTLAAASVPTRTVALITICVNPAAVRSHG